MKPKKSLGQNFLNNEKILNFITEIGNINENDIILEIGPGTGKLTKKLIEKKPLRLIAVEKDRNLIKILENKFGKKIEIINRDILNCFNEFKFTKPVKVFGNLPYNISTKILTSFIKQDDLFKKYHSLSFVFQKEVAERIVAEVNTKDYGRLSILSSWKMNKSKILDISPKCFYPIPKVWSSLVVFQPKKELIYEIKSKNLEHVTTIFFNQRRKMIKKPMKQLFENYEDIAKNLKIDLNLRPQNLSVNKYLEICKLYERLTQ